MAAKKQSSSKKKLFELSDEELARVLSDENLDSVTGGAKTGGVARRVEIGRPSLRSERPKTT